MTRMRVVGLFGISAVLIGFLLVLWKIARNRGFLWLLRRHLWTVAIAVYVYSVIPVDVFVMQYNVRRILAGDSAPSVQISVHPISAEGVLCLPPLTQCRRRDCARRGVCLPGRSSWTGRKRARPRGRPRAGHRTRSPTERLLQHLRDRGGHTWPPIGTRPAAAQLCSDSTPTRTSGTDRGSAGPGPKGMAGRAAASSPRHPASSLGVPSFSSCRRASTPKPSATADDFSAIRSLRPRWTFLYSSSEMM